MTNKDLLNELIDALTILPGVGKKSAQRMALYLLDRKGWSISLPKNKNKQIKIFKRFRKKRGQVLLL